MNNYTLKDFPVISTDKLRYADTDRQGHVNNAVFATFLETGRVEFLYDPENDLLSEGGGFVIAALHLNFLEELTWPGTVKIGTGIRKIGNSSIKLYQMIFQGDTCVAAADTVIVQTRNNKSLLLNENSVNKLKQWLLPEK